MSEINGRSNNTVSGAVRMPMFPLGSVLFPELGLPLRIFEPRYRQMIEECISADGEFAVVLIERGSEVGGGEVRLGVATTARILDAALQDDGTIGVFSVGTARVEVTEWLPDAPYPVAMVVPFSDHVDSDVDSDVAVQADNEAIIRVVKRLRSALARRAEANLVAAPATIELSPEPTVALWQACGLVPATPLDDYGLLRTRTISDRIHAIDALLDASDEQVRFHMS